MRASGIIITGLVAIVIGLTAALAFILGKQSVSVAQGAITPTARESATPPLPSPIPKPLLDAKILNLRQAIIRGGGIDLFATAYDSLGGSVAIDPFYLKAQIGGRELAVTEGVNEPSATVFLLDTSASMGQARFEYARSILVNWVDAMKPNDVATIVTFGSRILLAVPFTGDKVALTERLKELKWGADDSRDTALAAAIASGIAFTRQENSTLPVRRNLLVLTDGVANAEASDADFAVLMAKLAVDPVPIYVLAFKNANPQTGDALSQLSNLTQQSGGDIRIADVLDSGPYQGLHQAATEVMHFRVACAECVAGSDPVNVQLQARLGETKLASRTVTVSARGAPSSQ